jgi:hypothetical protein
MSYDVLYKHFGGSLPKESEQCRQFHRKHVPPEGYRSAKKKKLRLKLESGKAPNESKFTNGEASDP